MVVQRIVVNAGLSMMPGRIKTAMNGPIVKCLCSLSRASCIALVLCLFMRGLLFAAPITQIFVLHSYSQEYPWTQGQHEGFKQALSADTRVDAAISTEYLDTKRHTYDEAYTREMARHLRIKYKDYKPAAIYVTDDNALLFARDHLSRLFPGTPVFFSGVNDHGVQNSLDSSLFTGVFERKEVAPNLEWLLGLDKDANDLIFIGDGSNTHQAIERQARTDLIPYRLRATFISEKRLDRALARLKELPGKYLFLTTLGGMIDANGQVLPLHDIIKSLVLTGRIVISMEDVYITEGVLGGSVTSSQKQGMNAARLFLAHMHGKPIVDLPPMIESPNALIFDERALQQFGLNLPESLRDQAVLLNPRPGFYERHRSLILGSLTGLAALLFCVVTGAVVILTRKNRELGLARNSAETANALFNQLAEQSRTVHWKVNADGVYTHVSPISQAVLGYRPEELVNKKHFYDFFPREARGATKTSVFEFFAQKKPFHDMEHATRTKDGQLIWILTNGVPVLDDHGTLLGYRGSDSDITPRKRMQEDLIESEERLKLALTASKQGWFDLNIPTGAVNVSPEYARIIGYEPEAFHTSYQEWIDCIHPDDRADVLKIFRKCIEAGGSQTIEYRRYAKNEDWKWIRSIGEVVEYDSANNPIRMIGTHVDITEQKQAEKALRDSEESLRTILEASPDPMAIYDSSGAPLYINPAFTNLFLWTLDELKGRRIPFVPEDQKNITMAEIRKIYCSGEPSVFETQRHTKDGRTLEVIVSAAVFKGPDGIPAGMVVNLTDISERKLLQAQYEQAKKMESIGTLAGGIAHDFNNLLMGIQGRASLMAFHLEPAHPNFEHIHAIEAYVRSASDLTKQLLGFAQGGKYEVKPIDMNEVVLSSSAMFGRTRKQIQIHTHFNNPPPVAEADRGQIEQVLLNMYVNAWQAMPNGGELFLETKIVTLDDQYCKSHLASTGRYVKVSVTDTGIGMNKATRRQIFDPFFSTKEKGRGTGLGLASAYGIIKNHGGMITVYSEIGHGTTFNIYLPISDKDVYRELHMESGPVKGSERILLVDDEEIIIDVGQAMLGELGYRVIVANGGPQAIEAVKSAGNKIDLVLLDMIMPGMDGGKTFDRLHEIHPKLPVILSSGYAINEQASDILRRGGNGFIQKPFNITDLSKIIRKVLDEAMDNSKD